MLNKLFYFLFLEQLKLIGMKKSLQDKLKKYGAMAAAVAGGAATADAQIVYTDVIPDTTFCNDGDVYNLDLNNDLINDFQIMKSSNSSAGGGTFGSKGSFWSFSSNTQSVNISPMSSNRVLRMGSGAAALSSGASIGATASSWGGSTYMARERSRWSYSYYISTYTTYNGTSTVTYSNPYTWSSSYNSTYGNWANQTSKYLGLEFQILGQTHYGWARVTVQGVNCVTVEEYAYETMPNVAILAGDKGLSTSIADLNLIEDITVFAANDVLNVNVPAEVVGYNIKLVDVLGRTIVNETIANSSHRIDVSKLKTGVYIVLIEGQGKAFSEKITIN